MDCRLPGSRVLPGSFQGPARCQLQVHTEGMREEPGARGEGQKRKKTGWRCGRTGPPLPHCHLPGVFFCRPLPLPTSAPYAKKRKKSVEQLEQPPRRCHCGPKMPLSAEPPGVQAREPPLSPEPLGMQARDRASSADHCGAGSSSSTLERATCRNRGTANTFDLMIPSGSGCEEAAQGSCGTAGSPPPCPPEGACQELGIWGGAFQNGPCSGKSDFIERSVL